jgi:hypothetical protein
MINFQKFFKIYESTVSSFEIPYIIGDMYTSGSHAFGDSPEFPAEDPSKIIEPKIIYDSDELSKILKIYDCVISQVRYERYEWGSYHERQLYCNAFLIINSNDNYGISDDMISEIEDSRKEDDYYFPLTGSNSYVRSKKDLVVEKLPFKSFNDILKNWKEMVNSSKIKTPQGSSEEFWNKKISNAVMMNKHNKGMYDGD